MSEGAAPDDVAALALPGVEPPAAAYRVLARKYRPQTFADLIGQEAMVRTLRNAFASGRIAQAYVLTGVRGVGKTTTARILARALNYEPLDGPAGGGGPTLDMPGLGRHCRDIIESRHVDVQEMDAASNTGIGDIREIIEAARYKPVLARYKVFIIDEVHMLSTAAFNGLLKTLEEPPEHVKFIFATTEIRKVPVTVLSRCQRFDLRRVDAGVLAAHLRGICTAEGVGVEPEALGLVARAAEGSVRDALSLLDQAIAHAGAATGGQVRGEEVRALLGLADKARVIDLFEALMRGDIAAALTLLREQYDAGADPAVVMAELAEFTHFVTRLKILPQTAEDASLIEAERLRGSGFAEALSMRVLARAWQMLTRGLTEVQQAAKPMQAAEMALVRLAYAADLPTPDDALRRLRDEAAADRGPGPSGGNGGSGGGGARAAMGSAAPRLAMASQNPAPRPAPQPPAPAVAGPRLAGLADVVALAVAHRDLKLKFAIETQARLVAFEEGRIEIALAPGGSVMLVQELQNRLTEWTGRRWLVALSSEPGEPTLGEAAQAERAAIETGVRADPLVAAVLARFPGASIVDIRAREPEDAPPALTPEEYEGLVASMAEGPGPDDDLEF
ncbi:DNA polymerase III subunit gamma/tau [Ancylobacter lacus]|uniref:DNA polymerase III subunit gamma/tau n=1 Tax=Ancylobacter lacus TaxID=2579970 RepID=UPI001BCB592B|nr:DNA polymerase III subunit gamma/tau [Ancylobacter lacus]MBS7541023.1 DNA polymerase III subunit gamma/tau [Ancylobacter lacus]